MKISALFITIVLMAVVNCQASGEFVPSPNRNAAGMTNLVKRSLCNTFGGCGAKRSMTPHFGGYKMAVGQTASAMDQTSENDKRAADSNAKLISEILEDIVEHLKQDRNYKQGKYIMFVPRPTADGSNYFQRVDASVVGGEGATGETASSSPSGSGINANNADSGSPMEQSIQRTPSAYVRNTDDGW